MQLGGGQARAEGFIGDIEPFQRLPRFRRRGAAAQQPWNQLKLRHVVPALHGRVIHGAAHKIQPGDCQSLLVHRVVIQRIPILHVGHADDGVMLRPCFSVPKGQGIPSRRDGHAFSVIAFIIQIAAEIKILRPVSGGSTHKPSSLLRYFPYQYTLFSLPEQ